MKTRDQSAVWHKHATQWQKVGVPLKPSVEDGELMLAAVMPALNSRPAARIGVLGVTPEVVQLPWPKGVSLDAFDHSSAMISTVWQPNANIQSTATQAEWQNLALKDNALNIIVGDNSLGALPALGDYPEVLQELARVLAPDGIICLRAFIRPATPEALDTVASDALAGKIRSFHALKWRVAMTLSEAPDFSVAVQDIHAAFEAIFTDRHTLAQAGQWPLEVINTIDAYKDAPTSFTFPTLQALQDQCTPWFNCRDISYGHYELAERCPTITWRLNATVSNGEK